MCVNVACSFVPLLLTCSWLMTPGEHRSTLFKDLCSDYPIRTHSQTTSITPSDTSTTHILGYVADNESIKAVRYHVTHHPLLHHSHHRHHHGPSTLAQYHQY